MNGGPGRRCGCGAPLSAYNPGKACRRCEASPDGAHRDAGDLAGRRTGERIQALRERRGFTRPVLAGLVGMSASWLKGIERGTRLPPRLPLLVKLAEALAVGDVAALAGTDMDLGGAPVSLGSFRLPAAAMDEAEAGRPHGAGGLRGGPRRRARGGGGPPRAHATRAVPVSSRPGRRCEGCGAPLSRYNPGDVCSACARRVGVPARPGTSLLLVGVQVRRLRKAARMTQRELAARAGVSYRTVQTVEQALAPVRSSTTDRIAEALGVTAGDLTVPPADFSTRLYQLRRQRGWTLKVLAGFAGLTEGAVSKLENGRTASPGAATVAALAGALGVPLAGLLGAEPAEAAPGGTAVDEAEVARMVREAYQAGRADALAEAAAWLTGFVPGQAGFVPGHA